MHEFEPPVVMGFMHAFEPPVEVGLYFACLHLKWQFFASAYENGTSERGIMSDREVRPTLELGVTAA